MSDYDGGREEGAEGDDTNSHSYFFNKEFDKLMSDMQELRDMIKNTNMEDRDAEEQENIDARFVYWGSRVEEDLAAIRVKLDQRFRQMFCPFRVFHWDTYLHIDNHEPLERGADGHVIHALGHIDRSRMEKIKRSPEAQYAARIAYREGIVEVCIIWGFAGFSLWRLRASCEVDDDHALACVQALAQIH